MKKFVIAVIALSTVASASFADTTRASSTIEMGTAATIRSVAGDAEAPAAPEAAPQAGDAKSQNWFFFGNSYRPVGGGYGVRFGVGTGYGYSYGNGYGYGSRGGYGYGGYGYGGGYGYRWGGRRW